MTSGSTVYVETPWGLFTQQQFLLLISALMYTSTLAGDYTEAVTFAKDFYNTAWPLCEAASL